MRIPPRIRHLLLGPLVLGIIAPPSALFGAQPSARRPDVPAAYTEIREADLRRDVGEMASPEMRGREGGTLDEMRASMWVAEQYRRIGLEPMGDGGTWFQWLDMTRKIGRAACRERE